MNGIVTSVTTTPPSTAISAAAIWPRSFHWGLSGRASSIAPTSAIRHAPATIVHVCTVPPEPGAVPAVWRRLIVAGSQNSAPTSTPARMASPPSAGVARSARPRSEGMTTAPTRRARRAVNGVSRAATAVATRNAKRASQYRMPSEKHASRGGPVREPAKSHRSCYSYVYVNF